LRGFRVTEGSKQSLLIPSIGQIISAGTITMPDTLNGDNTYGVDIDLPASYPNGDIGVIVQARDMNWQRKISIVGVNPASEATVIYAQHTTHVVNTVTGYILSETQGSTPTYISVSSLSYDYIHEYTKTYFDIYVLHAKGTVTQIGDDVAVDTYSNLAFNFDYEAQRSATWDCPETSLVETDALLFVLNLQLKCAYQYGHLYPTSVAFVTGQLGWTKLYASTWTLYRYIKVHSQFADPRNCTSYVYFGDSTYSLRASNVLKPVNQDYWGQFFADSSQSYYTKNPSTGVMTAWTPGNMTYGTQSTWDPIFNISPLLGWDKGSSPTNKVRIFAATGYSVYDASAAEAVAVYTIGANGIPSVDYSIFLKNYGGE
jgi:hypothetical protein